MLELLVQGAQLLDPKLLDQRHGASSKWRSPWDFRDLRVGSGEVFMGFRVVLRDTYEGDMAYSQLQGSLEVGFRVSVTFSGCAKLMGSNNQILARFGPRQNHSRVLHSGISVWGPGYRLWIQLRTCFLGLKGLGS